MLTVGLTGNIGAGKSAVAQVWRELGGTVVDADEMARRAVEPGTDAHRRIVEAWGDEVVQPGGGLDRAALRRIVFADPEARARLESIVHPAVEAQRDAAFAAAAATGAPLAAAEVPLLFEVGLQDRFDVVVLVDAPEPVREARLVEGRGLDPAEARSMMAAQMRPELKRAAAHAVIENGGTLEELRARAREVWRALEVRAAREAAAPEPTDA